MPKKGGFRKKTRTHVEEKDEDDDYVPRSFIIKRGQIGKHVGHLLTDFRNCMYPNTAVNLKERRSNNLKDFLSVAGLYGVTHMMIFTSTDKSNYLRIIKNPGGPTITFKIKNYWLSKDIVAFNQNYRKKNKIYNEKFLSSPLLVMSGFSNLEENDSYKLSFFLNNKRYFYGMHKYFVILPRIKDKIVFLMLLLSKFFCWCNLNLFSYK